MSNQRPNPFDMERVREVHGGAGSAARPLTHSG